ncbi:MAG: ABC transporter substrate-binding protein [Phycisphaerales bacterium JB050]
MRWVILALVTVWTLLTVVAYTVVLPSEAEDIAIIAAYFEVDGEAPAEVQAFLDGFRQFANAEGVELPPDLTEIMTLDPVERDRILDLFRAYHASDRPEGTPSLDSVPRLVWSTDDNPARRTQAALFRAWYLKTYGEPIDIVTDPANRDITKVVIQCVAGKGPDIIESYGPSQLQQMVEAGVALDVTDAALADGFGIERAFTAAWPSMGVEQEDGGWRQYAFPCNVGYTVLFYHRDLFRQAGVEPPSGPWSIADATEKAKVLIENARERGIERRVGIMNLGAWDMALAAGGRFLSEDGTVSVYNSPETIAGLSAFQNMMYVDRVSPTPAEAASMATAGGANMNTTAETASASSLFADKVAAMYVGGRWEYASMASRNFEQVIRPAAERELASGDLSDEQASLIREAIAILQRDILNPLSSAQYDALVGTLNDSDRSRLLQVGVAHVPSVTGTPFYMAGARVAVVNRSSELTEEAVRFLRFLGSEVYNEQINGAFDSICGVPAYCLDDDGISGPPKALPGLEQMDSPVFVEAMQDYAQPEQLSDFIGPGRLGALAGPVIEKLEKRDIGPAEAARVIENRINIQIAANLRRDASLREKWEAMVGAEFDPDPSVPLRQQVERARSMSMAGGDS